MLSIREKIEFFVPGVYKKADQKKFLDYVLLLLALDSPNDVMGRRQTNLKPGPVLRSTLSHLASPPVLIDAIFFLMQP